MGEASADRTPATPPGAVREDPWVERLARLGLSSKAVLYFVIGGLAVAVAFDDGVQGASRDGALRVIARQPLGEAMLFLLAGGFCGYAAWRVAQGVFDHDRRGEAPAALALRGSKLGSGAFYLFLAALALWLVISEDEEKAGFDATRQATGGVLGWTGGRWIAMAAGVAVIGVGAWNVRRGVARGFLDSLRLNRMSLPQRRAATVIGTIGLCARGLTFGLIGAFLITAGATFDETQAVGLDGALARVARQPTGTYLLLAAAVGLLAYALLSAVEARWKDVSPKGPPWPRPPASALAAGRRCGRSDNR